MRRRLFAALAFACLCLMTYGSALAATTISVWVALSDNGGVYEEAAEALRAAVEREQPGRIHWRIAHWSQLTRPTPEPQAVVAVGSAALRGMKELFAGDAGPPPLLAILLPRQAFERIADPRRLRLGSVSAVYIDQPPGRQLELIRLALPAARNVGILAGADSRSQVSALEKAAKERGFNLVTAEAGRDNLFAALQSLLPDIDLLLAQPDPAVFNSQTAASILTASYRRHRPLFGFSPAWVKAGALLALYSTPAQIGVRGAELLRPALQGKPLPPPQWPREFMVSVNRDVARSLGMALDEAKLGEQLRERDRP